MDNKKSGEFISALRREKALSQKQLAEKLNVTDKAVSKWETGRSAPDISLLIPLAETLGVTVAEILKGEKLPEEEIQTASDEIIVKTIHKSRKSILCTVLSLICVVTIVFASFPAYYFFTSVNVNDTGAIEKKANDYFRTDEERDMKIIKSVQKGDYYAFLLQSESETKLRIFTRNRIFKNRISVLGGSGGGGVEGDTVHLYCTGEYGMTISVFYGYDLSAAQYSYIYKGTRCTKEIEDNTVLDMFVAVDDEWSHPVVY